MRRVEYLGENLYHEMAMDEAPARRESERKDDDGGPSFGDLNAALDEAQAAIDAARKEIRSGYDSKAGAFSYDRVRRRIADARDCMDQLEEHLGGGARGEDAQVDHTNDFRSLAAGGPDRDAAFGRARDGRAADARMACDERCDLDALFPRQPPQRTDDSAPSADIADIFRAGA
jgi:hypothetical protein